MKKLEIVLCKVNAERIEKTPPEIDLAIKREDNYSILDQKEDSFSLKLNSEILWNRKRYFTFVLNTALIMSYHIKLLKNSSKII